MSRLTKRTNNTVWYNHDGNRYGVSDMDGVDTLHVMNRLAAYEDIGTPKEFAELMQAKEDGRLVALPCKLGDTVYFIDRFHNEVYKEAEIDGIGLHWTNRKDIGDYIPPSIIGKNVFLTCEEAEAALKKSPSSGGEHP